MKGTDRQLFLAHQRRCVKCQALKQARESSGYNLNHDHDWIMLLRVHESMIKVLYHQDGALGPLK